MHEEGLIVDFQGLGKEYFSLVLDIIIITIIILALFTQGCGHNININGFYRGIYINFQT